MRNQTAIEYLNFMENICLAQIGDFRWLCAVGFIYFSVFSVQTTAATVLVLARMTIGFVYVIAAVFTHRHLVVVKTGFWGAQDTEASSLCLSVFMRLL